METTKSAVVQKSFIKLKSWATFLSFSPSLKQKLFLCSDHKFKVIRSPNQVGKSKCAAYESTCLSIGYSPFRHIDPKPKTGMVLSSSHKQSVSVAGKLLWELIPKHLLKEGSNWNIQRGWTNSVAEFKNGSVILFRSAESSSLSIAGLTLDWIWIDEICPENIFTEIVTRVAVKNGNIIFTLTPIGRNCEWLKTMIEGDIEKNIPPKINAEQTLIQLTKIDCPYRTEESIETQMANCPAREYNQRILGAWDGVETERLFVSFMEDNIVDSVPQAKFDIYLGVDHGELMGKEVALLVLKGKDKSFIYDEYISSSRTSPEQDCRQIKIMLDKHGISTKDVSAAYGDINSAGKSGGGHKINELFENELGIHFNKPNKKAGSIENGCRLIDIAFQRNHLFVHSRCLRTIKALEQYKDLKTDPQKDIIDALRYAATPILESYYFNQKDVNSIRIWK